MWWVSSGRILTNTSVSNKMIANKPVPLTSFPNINQLLPLSCSLWLYMDFGLQCSSRHCPLVIVDKGLFSFKHLMHLRNVVKTLHTAELATGVDKYKWPFPTTVYFNVPPGLGVVLFCIVFFNSTTAKSKWFKWALEAMKSFRTRKPFYCFSVKTQTSASPGGPAYLYHSSTTSGSRITNTDGSTALSVEHVTYFTGCVVNFSVLD